MPARGWEGVGGGMGSDDVIGTGFYFGANENALELDRGVVTQHCKCTKCH